jgi:hypothetical protein
MTPEEIISGLDTIGRGDVSRGEYEAVQAAAKLVERETLVQEVIRLSKARDAVSPYAHKMRAHHASLLQVAARKLAEWKP